MKRSARFAAMLFAVIFVCVCFVGCGKKEEEVINVDDDPEYGATIDPATVTETQAKGIIIGILPKAAWYQSFVTEPAFTTSVRLSTVDYTAEENAGYYPLASKYGLTSYDNLIYGLNKYFSPTYAKLLIKALTGKDAASEEGREVVRYKMIGGVLHIFPEFEIQTVPNVEITADIDAFEITERNEDSFKVKLYASINGSDATQEISIKKIDGLWYVDGIIQ